MAVRAYRRPSERPVPAMLVKPPRQRLTELVGYTRKRHMNNAKRLSCIL